MHSHDRAIMTSRGLAAVVVAAMTALAVAGCNQNYLGADPAACKAALQAQYVNRKGHLGAEPAACKGVPKAQVQRFAQQITSGR